MNVRSKAANQRSIYRQPVEVPGVLVVQGEHYPVTLSDLSESGCRVVLDVELQGFDETRLEFALPGGARITAYGHIAARFGARGGAKGYGIAFTSLPRTTAKRITAELHELGRRTAMGRSPRRLAPGSQGRAGRGAYRLEVELSIQLERPDGTLLDARSLDVSANGVRLITGDTLVDGERVMVAIRPPDIGTQLVRPHPTYAITPFGTRARRGQPARGFTPVRAAAHVVQTITERNGVPSYGLAFEATETYAREEVARFVHYSQLEKAAQNR